MVGLRDAPIARKTLFLGGCVRMFPEEVRIWIYRQSKEDHPHLCGWMLSNSLRAWIQKVEEGWIHFFFEQGHPSSPAHRFQLSWFSGLWIWIGAYTIDLSGSQVFRIRLKLHKQLLGLHFADSRSLNLSSIIVWANLLW